MNRPLQGVARLLLGACLAVGCATSGESFFGAPIAPQAGDPVMAGGLLIRTSEDSELSSPNFGLVEVSFENRSPTWMRLSNLALDFGARNPLVRVPGGDDLVAWQWANQGRQQARADGADAALLFLGLAGLIVGIAADTPDLSVAAQLVSVGSFAALDVREHERQRRAFERAPLYPETHLLAPNLAVPPGLVAKRWVVVQTNGSLAEVLTDARLDYDTPDGVRRAVRLYFRTTSCGSEWQRQLCAW